MKKSQAETRIKRLRQLINNYRYHYHVLDESIMSEAAADSLKHELTQLETEFPELITPDSPTQRVAGQPLAKFTQIRHSSRMLSLNDVFNANEVKAWEERLAKLLPDRSFNYFADIKMDGLACALTYENGEFVRALTRGDGFIGEDVTLNIRTIDNVPLRLRSAKGYELFLQGRTEIRGEVIMYKADFARLNKEREAESKPLFANPRNLAAGTIRQLDPQLAAVRPLHFRAYDLLRDDPSEVATNEYAYQALRALGLTANQEARTFDTTEQVLAYAEHWDKARHELRFNTDGLVIKLNDRQLFRDLGVVGKAPRGAVAYKYAAEEATTIVKDIVLSIGRTGTANPVAVFKPVVVAGTTVQHATLHNADEVARKDIRIGDTVIVYKAGDIIPQVLRVLPELRPKGTKPFNIEAEAKRQYPDIEFERIPGEAAYRMKNVSGPLLLKRALEHFASKGAMDIDTLGERNVAALVDSGLVHDLADIYRLSLEQVLSLERFAEISAKKLIDAIAATKIPPLPRFIYGLGIRHIGLQTANDLSQAFKSLETLEAASLEDLVSIEGIGSIVAEAITAWFADEDNQELLHKFADLGVRPHYEQQQGGSLTDKRFVITGTLERMSRDQAAELVRSHGGIFQSAVAKDTDYLVVGKNVGASKLTKATQLGTAQLDETAFLKLIGAKL